MKSQPQRSCVACRTVRPKEQLVRVVRTPDRRVLADPEGKLAGRGAYLCPSESCLKEAIRNRRLERALGIPLGESVRQSLAERIAGLSKVPGQENASLE